MSKLICIGDLAYVCSSFLPLSWLHALARMSGRLRHWRSRQTREVVRENLRSYFGSSQSEAEIDRMTRLFFEYKELRILLYYLFPGLSPRQLETIFPMEGLEHLDHMRSEKKGGILLLSHMNSIIGFIARDILRSRGYDVRVAYPTETLPFTPTRFRRFWDRIRPPVNAVGGADFFAQFNVRPIVRRLQEGAIILLTGDGWHSAGLVKAKFLGRELYFTTGAVGIARAVGCPILPLFVLGYPPDRLRVVIEKPLPLETTEDEQRDLELVVSNYVTRLEAHLVEDPLAWEHWFEERALETMAKLPEIPLEDRYRV